MVGQIFRGRNSSRVIQDKDHFAVIFFFRLDNVALRLTAAARFARAAG
jgi:hypothetical protein